MRYHDIFRHAKLEDSQKTHGWQLRIAIDPSAIIATNPNNKINVIKKILEGVTHHIPADPKYAVAETDAAIVEYDATTNNAGRDTQSRGKEVCIYFCNSNFTILSSEEFKVIILSLWRALQDANVPLLYTEVPGDQKIVGPAGIPTPFSYTSIESIPGTDNMREEWKDHHGLVFKEFVGFDKNHPLLKVVITEQDLQAAGISYDSDEVRRIQVEYYKNHQEMALKKLHEDIKRVIDDPMPNYRDVLFDDRVIESVKGRFERYLIALCAVKEAFSDESDQQKRQDRQIEERERLRDELDKDKEQMHEFNYIIKHYPHECDGRFSEVAEINDQTGLRSLPHAVEPYVDCVKEFRTRFDHCIQKLRDEYCARICIIEQDYYRHTDSRLTDKKSQPYAPGFLAKSKIRPIFWYTYFPNWADRIDALIEKNPERMQVFYRRIIFLHRESRVGLAFPYKFDKLHTPIIIHGQRTLPASAGIQNQSPTPTSTLQSSPHEQPITRIAASKEIIDMYCKALKGLITFIERNENNPAMQKSVSIFSLFYISTNGLDRANVYKNALSNNAFNLQQKTLLLYALLATQSPSTTAFQAEVVEAILDDKNRHAAEALNLLNNLIPLIFDDFRVRRELLNRVIGEIVHYLDHADVSDCRAIPDRIWERLNQKSAANALVLHARQS